MTTITKTNLADICWSGCEPSAGGDIFNGDKEYKPTTEKDMKRLNSFMWLIRRLPYRENSRDCDDYSRMCAGVASLVLPGRAFGIIWADGLCDAGYHAANCFITADNEMKIYEPQTGQI